MVDSSDKKRLLLELDNIIRNINGDVINPLIPQLEMEKLSPVLTLVARARALYLKELMELADIVGDEMPNGDQIKRLRNYRLTFEELLGASQALTTAIERGYLDVRSG